VLQLGFGLKYWKMRNLEIIVHFFEETKLISILRPKQTTGADAINISGLLV
jgi:hypothetical protein